MAPYLWETEKGAFPWAPRFLHLPVVRLYFLPFCIFPFQSFYLTLRAQLKSQVKNRAGQNLTKSQKQVKEAAVTRMCACVVHMALLDVSPIPALCSLQPIIPGAGTARKNTLAKYSACSSRKYPHAHPLGFHAWEKALHTIQSDFVLSSNEPLTPKNTQRTLSNSGCMRFCDVVVEFFGHGQGEAIKTHI